MKEMTVVSIGSDATPDSIEIVIAADHFTDNDLIAAIREAMVEFIQSDEGMAYIADSGDYCPIFEGITCIPERISLKHGWLYRKTIDLDTIVTVDMDINALPDDTEVIGVDPDGEIIRWSVEQMVPYGAGERLDELREDDLVDFADIELERLVRRYPDKMKKIVDTSPD